MAVGGGDNDHFRFLSELDGWLPLVENEFKNRMNESINQSPSQGQYKSQSCSHFFVSGMGDGFRPMAMNDIMNTTKKEVGGRGDGRSTVDGSKSRMADASKSSFFLAAALNDPFLRFVGIKCGDGTGGSRMDGPLLLVLLHEIFRIPLSRVVY